MGTVYKRICEWEGCRIPFETTHPNKRFHTQHCQTQAVNIRRRGPDRVIDEQKAQEKERDYKEVAGEVIRLLGEQKSIFSPAEKKSWRAYYHKNKITEASVLCLSDIHIGQINKTFNVISGKTEETYNFDIFQQELKRLREGIQKIKDLLSNSYNLPELYVFGLGDWITGDRIFQGQLYKIEEGGVGGQLWKAVYSLSDFFHSLKGLYQKITIIPVIGNHSRSRESARFDEPIENNFEYNIFKILEIIFQRDRQIEVKVPNYWWHLTDIMGWKYFLAHGDNIKGWAGVPFYGLLRSGNEFYMSLPVKFQIMCLGHFHCGCLDIPLSDVVRLKLNSCWVPKDEFGFKVFHRYAPAEQYYFGVGEKRPVTWEYKISLTEK